MQAKIHNKTKFLNNKIPVYYWFCWSVFCHQNKGRQIINLKREKDFLLMTLEVPAHDQVDTVHLSNSKEQVMSEVLTS